MMDGSCVHLEPELPPGDGKWAAAVSGGADSVAMLLLCRAVVGRVVTVDHETRAGASGEDAAFVVRLSTELNLPCTVIRRSEIEPLLGADAPTSPSARYRLIRHLAFARVVREGRLEGVLLAHHADDVAETVALRLLRGSGYLGVSGIARETRVRAGSDLLRIWRPLLGVTRESLRGFVCASGQLWREDASNALDDYGRNRVRRALDVDPALASALTRLGWAARQYRDALAACVGPANPMPPVLGFGAGPVGRLAARRFLAGAVGAGNEEAVSERVVGRFLTWIRAGRFSVFQIPGGRLLRQRGGRIVVGPVAARAD